MNPLLYFWLFLKASLFSTGGMGNLPSLHTDLLARHWATEQHFAESLAIGQIAPGPSGLWVISLGYLTNGLEGALLALIAIIIPPLIVLLLDRIYQQIRNHPAVIGFIQGLSLAVEGIFVLILLNLMQNVGADIRSISIAVIAMAIAATRRVPIIGIVILAALAGNAIWSNH